MSTITAAQQQAIRDYFAGVTEIPAGLGTKEAACSIAGINLALTGRLTDAAPACMSFVLCRWIISVQDAMPSRVRNSPEWRELLPLAAGTGREEEREQERLEIIMEWMWGEVLPFLQPVAARGGYGEAWGAMCRSRDEDAAHASPAALAAADAARAAGTAAGDAAGTAAGDAARTAAWAAGAADAARAAGDAWAAGTAAWAAGTAAGDAGDAWAAEAAERAASAASAAAGAAEDAAWDAFRPVMLLRKLINAGAF